MQYNPAVFEADCVDSAKTVILTPEGEATEDRWRRETPYLIDLIAALELDSASVVLDYGCGIGRLSKAIIDKFDSFVVGVDISAKMRAMAIDYVASDRFVCCHPDTFAFLNIRCDAAVAVWCLQHCEKPERDISNIRGGLPKDAKFFVVNNIGRALPTERGWTDDGVDIRPMLDARFECLQWARMGSERVAPLLNGTTYWAIYRAK